MAYCRSYDSNHQVYLYQDVNGKLCCCGCKLLQGTRHIRGRERGLKYAQESSVWFETRSAAILHLRHHRLFGHKFPQRAERELMHELRVYGEYPAHDSANNSYAAYKKAIARFNTPAKRRARKKLIKELAARKVTNG